MSSKQQRKRLKPTDGTQPTFYVGDRFCTNTSTEKPYSFKHKMVVGPWKDRRALIECLFGYHNFCTYSSSRQDIVFDGKAQSRAFRAYIKGYYWKDFVDDGGRCGQVHPLGRRHHYWGESMDCGVVTPFAALGAVLPAVKALRVYQGQGA